ncbi:DUF952 domain-containing protein [Micromonospora sp. M12]
METARRHFAGATGLTLLSVEEERLGDALRWEPSRGGLLFPHLYGPLPVTAVVAARALPADTRSPTRWPACWLNGRARPEQVGPGAKRGTRTQRQSRAISSWNRSIGLASAGPSR